MNLTNLVITIAIVDVVLTILVVLKYRNIFNINVAVYRVKNKIKAFFSKEDVDYNDDEQEYDGEDFMEEEDSESHNEFLTEELEEENRRLKTDLDDLTGDTNLLRHQNEAQQEMIDALREENCIINKVVGDLTEEANAYESALRKIASLHRPVGKNAGIKIAREALSDKQEKDVA